MRTTSQAEPFPVNNQIARASSTNTNRGESTEQEAHEANEGCDDQHGEPNGNGHGNQSNRRQGYAINQNLDHG